MAEVVQVPPALNSLFDQVSQKFDQTEAADVIHELKRRFPNKQLSFDQTDLYGALKQLYVLGDVDQDGDQKVLEILSKKASKKDDIFNLINIYKKASAPRKDDFVGRDADVSNIIKLVTDPRVPGINLFGDSGVGKTTLAKEVSRKLEGKFDPLFIDLRGTKDVNTVYFKVLEMFELPPWDYSKERIYTHLRNLTTKTLLILDNVELFLSNKKEDGQKRREEFLEFLRTMMSTEASKRGCLKVILTSRIRAEDSLLEEIQFIEYELLPLTEKHSKQLMSWRLGDDQIDEEQGKALIEIADFCRNTPYLLERAEQLLRQNFSKPSEVLEKLKTLKNNGVPEEFVCINELFESLPNDEIRQVAVKTSLLQRPFSVSTAMKITEILSNYDAELDLELLAVHKIITAEDVNGERKYDLHALFRDFVSSYLCKEEPPVYKQAYEEAENQFVEHFSKIFRQQAGNLDKDFVRTYKELQEDKANLELSIDLVTRKEAFDLILQSDDVKETASVAMLFEAFKSIKERRKLFGEWAKNVEEKGKYL